jgi:hypothetical protein
MFTIEMLPADYGDCLWIEYGDSKAPKRILVDCGTISTFNFLKKRIQELPEKQRRFELLVISHIDTDHIDAAVKLLNAKTLNVDFQEIWFNGYKHLCALDTLGALQGAYVEALIDNLNIPWNKAFKGLSVVVPESGALPTKKLPGGLQLTLLSPSWPELENLRPVWKKELAKKGLTPGDDERALKKLAKDKKYADLLGAAGPNIAKLAAAKFKEDTSKPNGSSIALLAEFKGKRCLLAGDAFPSVIAASIRRIQKDGDPLYLDAFKVPHHGSKHNTSPELLELLHCQNFLISSSGKKFGHPDPEAIARIIQNGDNPKLHFNYLSPQNEIWDNASLMKKATYQAVFPPPKSPGMKFCM